MKRNFVISSELASLTLCFCVLPLYSQKDNENPNIIYILVDDLGYGDVGCYGQKYVKTPNIDKLANEGILFTQHYASAPVSAPTRGCLMTGKHLGNAYIRNNRELKEDDPRKTGQEPLPKDTYTLADMLKERGYVTALIGKWGLGSIASHSSPNKQGFDFFYGYADQVHAHNHYPDFLWRNDKQEFLNGNVTTVHPEISKEEEVALDAYKKYQGKNYSLDLMADEAVKFIRSNQDKPFFLYLAFTVPHKALQVPDESLKMYKGLSDEIPYDGKRGYTPHPKPLSAYAAMITRMDEKIGVIMDYLKEAGLNNNTIVMFTSDNGPASGGGLDTQFFNSSGGLKGQKGQLYEGGIRVPFVARWPKQIKPGTRTDHISAQYDVMATFAELTGDIIEDTDGISFLNTLLGNDEAQEKHEYLYWEFSGSGGQYAIRMNEWKGVKNNVRGDADSKWEIYNISEDDFESENVVSQHPELVSEFDKIIRKRTPAVIDEWNFEK